MCVEVSLVLYSEKDLHILIKHTLLNLMNQLGAFKLYVYTFNLYITLNKTDHNLDLMSHDTIIAEAL